MSIPGYPMGDGDQDPTNDGRATPSEPPPDDWNAEFTAIVSGISGSMRWEATTTELDDRSETARSESTPSDRPDIPRAPESIWTNALPDTADDRKVRRELRRQERAEELAAFQQAQAEREAAHAADTEHYEPPPPPPLPSLRRSSILAIALLVVGLVLIASPTLVPVSLELALVIGLAMVVGGGVIFARALRVRHRRRDTWDDGAEV